jgi:hypothetical protein
MIKAILVVVAVSFTGCVRKPVVVAKPTVCGDSLGSASPEERARVAALEEAYNYCWQRSP